LAFLTVASLIESMSHLVYGFYCCCRSLSDPALQNTTDGLYCAYTGLKTLGLLLVSFLYTLIFLSRLLSTFFEWIINGQNGYIPITNTRTPQRLNQNTDAINRALEDYTEFLKKVKSDKNTVETVLREHESELSACRQHFDSLRKPTTKISHFQKDEPTVPKSGDSRYSQLSKEYIELFKTYPVAEFHLWTTSAEKAGLTFQIVEQAHINYEEHHVRFLSIAEELLSESNLLHQEVKDMFEEYKDLEKQISIMRR